MLDVVLIADADTGPVAPRPLSNGTHIRLDALTPEHPRRSSSHTLLPVGTTDIICSDSVVELTSDLSRTFPLLWHSDGKTLRIATSLRALASHLGTSLAVDPVGVRQFEALSYVLGTRTMFAGVHQLPGGSTTRIDLRTGTHTLTYTQFQRSRLTPFSSPEEADEVFTHALDQSMNAMLERLNGRRLLIPLSGGLDSRLLLAWLKDNDVTDVLTFTYGRPASREVSLSRELALTCGYEWTSVELTEDHLPPTWASPQAADFIKRAWWASSLPHVQDWAALVELRARGTVTGEEVILPGHTVIGNLHDEALIASGKLTRQDLTSLLLDHHATLDGRAREAQKDPRFTGFVTSFINAVEGGDDAQSYADVLELFNVSERQAKYINHSMMTYTALGFAWDLPMLDAPMWEFAGRLPLSLSEGRSWYRSWVTRRYAASTGTNPATHSERRIPSSLIALGGRALKGVGLKTPIERLMVTSYVMSHPLALDLVVGDMSRPRLAGALLAGRNITGVYAAQLLQDAWNPHVTFGLRSPEGRVNVDSLMW